MTKKKTTPHEKTGRPEKIKESDLKLIKFMCEQGYTNKQIANELEVTEPTIYNWKNRHPEYFKALKDWKANANKNVERSLYQKAVGYTVKEEKVFVVSDGAAIGSHLEKRIVKKHYTPDTAACILWLKNRDPDNWREKVEVENSGSQDINVTIQEQDLEL